MPLAVISSIIKLQHQNSVQISGSGQYLLLLFLQVTRILERIIVRSFLYPALLTIPPMLSVADQYAYRPTGSTTAALIHLFHTTELLTDNQYVIVIAIDFSKAFDTVRYVTLLEKLACLDLPGCVYNWLADPYLEGMLCILCRHQENAKDAWLNKNPLKSFVVPRGKVTVK